MAKFTIILCVLLSAYGTQAGFLSTGVDLMKSNILAMMDQLAEFQSTMEARAGVSMNDLFVNIGSISSSYEEKIAESIAANSGSSACSDYLTQLRQVKNASIADAVTNIQSMIDTMKADVLVFNDLADVMLAAANNVEAKITQCLSNFFTMIPCFKEVNEVAITSIASNVTTLITSVTQLTVNGAQMTATMASFQLQAANDFSSSARDIYQVSQDCVVNSGNTAGK